MPSGEYIPPHRSPLNQSGPSRHEKKAVEQQGSKHIAEAQQRLPGLIDKFLKRRADLFSNIETAHPSQTASTRREGVGWKIRAKFVPKETLIFHKNAYYAFEDSFRGIVVPKVHRCGLNSVGFSGYGVSDSGGWEYTDEPIVVQDNGLLRVPLHDERDQIQGGPKSDLFTQESRNCTVIVGYSAPLDSMSYKYAQRLENGINTLLKESS